MNKRGIEDLLWNVILTLLVITIMIFLFHWISDVSSGDLIKSQMATKEVALALDFGRPQTTFYLNKSLFLKENKVFSNYGSASFSYSFFNPKIVSGKIKNVVGVKS